MPGGVNDGAFRGIHRDVTDIYFFTLSGGYANVVDDLAFTRVQAVPLPRVHGNIGVKSEIDSTPILPWTH